MDLRAYLPEGPITLEPMQRGLVPTGLYMEIPEGYEGQVRPRSGLAIKSGISVLNSPGTVDADYRGQVCVILINLSDKPFTINSGDRIAQMVFSDDDNLARFYLGFGGEEKRYPAYTYNIMSPMGKVLLNLWKKRKTK